MITNVPSSDDFKAEALELLGLAWDMAASLLSDLHEMEDFIIAGGSEDDSPNVPNEAKERYWRAARRHLTTALSLTQQGAEFGIKSKIAAVSPFLLLTDPGLGAKADTVDFSSLRTVDAQDLPKVHDAVVAPPIDASFRQRFSDLRAMRNRVMHTVSSIMPVAVHDTLESVLVVYTQFFPDRKWPAAREQMMANAPTAVLSDNLFEQRSAVYREIALATEVLSPALVRCYFGIDKRKRLYKCPECLDQSDSNFELYGHLSQLIEGTDDLLSLYCPICDESYPAIRGECDADCGGTVFSVDGDCLRCCRDGG